MLSLKGAALLLLFGGLAISSAQVLTSCPRVPRAVPKNRSSCGAERRDVTIKNAGPSTGRLTLYTLTSSREFVQKISLQPGETKTYRQICKGFQFYAEARDCGKCISILFIGSRGISRTIRISDDVCGGGGSRPTSRPRPTTRPPPADKPNIIFIMGDDVGARDFGFLGGRRIQTPVLDRLARSSVNFLSAWATPFCRTTRSVVMTGKLPFATGHFSQFELPPPAKLFFGQSFGNLAKAAGYRTLFSGKWQIFGKARGSVTSKGYGFDEYTIWGHSDVESFNDLVAKYDGPIPPGGGPPAGPFLKEWGRYSHPIIAKNDRFVDTDRLNFSSNMFLDHIQEFMRKNRNNGDASFVYFPMALAHDDWNFEKSMMTWVRMPVLNDAGEVTGYQGGEPGFGKMVSYMDTVIGLLLDGLKRDGLYNNTIVFFCTDNGSPNSAESDGFKGRTTDERGVRVPMLVHGGGGQIPARQTRQIFSLVDVYATLAGLMGTRVSPARPNSLDFSRFLRGAAASGPRKWMWSFHADERMARTREWIYDSRKTLYNCSATTVVEECEVVRDLEARPRARAVRRKFDAILDELERTGQANATVF